MSSFLKSLFKTKTRATFTGIISISSGTGLYDYIQVRSIRNDLIEKASHISNLPMATTDYPRKILLFVENQYIENQFKHFVKPVFDAGALDYEVILSKNPEKYVRELIWIGKDESRKRDHYPPPQRTWFQFFFGKYKAYVDPISVFLNKPKYDPAVGMVALGSHTFVQMVRGIEQGVLSNGYKELKSLKIDEVVEIKNDDIEKSSQEPIKDQVKMEEKSDEIKEKESNIESKETDSSPSDNKSDKKLKDTDIDIQEESELLPFSHENLIQSTPKDVPSLTFDTFDYPTIGYIPAENLTGWKNFPLRIISFFNQRYQMKEMGSCALDIVYDEQSQDPVTGIDIEEIDEVVKKQFKYYNYN